MLTPLSLNYYVKKKVVLILCLLGVPSHCECQVLDFMTNLSWINKTKALLYGTEHSATTFGCDNSGVVSIEVDVHKNAGKSQLGRRTT